MSLMHLPVQSQTGRSPKGDVYVENLRAEVSSERTSPFSRALLAQIDENPNLTLKQAWDNVEGEAASLMRVDPRPWPKIFEN